MASSDAEVVGSWPVKSRSVGNCTYEVIVRVDGFISCNCANWVYQRAKAEDHTLTAPEKNHCKHIREVVLPILRVRGVPKTLAELQAAREEYDGRFANLEV